MSTQPEQAVERDAQPRPPRRTSRRIATATSIGELTSSHQTVAVPIEPTTPSVLLRMAAEQNADLDRLERLMNLQMQWEANEAKKAYFEDFTRFKAEAVEIIKSKHVHFVNVKGNVTDYDHAELSNVLEALTPALSRHNLSTSWGVRQADGVIAVTCKLRHVCGFSEEVSMSAPPDESGGKNRVQAIGSTTTYLERYTLKAICGVAEKGQDTDGREGSEPGATDWATKVCEALIAQAKECAVDEEAALLWAMGNKVMAAFGDRPAYKRFKDAVISRRNELKGEPA